MIKSNLKNSYDASLDTSSQLRHRKTPPKIHHKFPILSPPPPSKILVTPVIYLMYHQGNREDFYRFKVLKFLVWFVKGVSQGLLFFPLAGLSRGVACGRMWYGLSSGGEGVWPLPACFLSVWWWPVLLLFKRRFRSCGWRGICAL